MNMMVVVWGEDAVIIDTGLMFPDESMPGVDLVIPDIAALLDRQWRFLGLILTPRAMKTTSAPFRFS